MEPLYCGHHWEPSNCPDCRGVLNSGIYHNWDKSKCPYYRGVLISDVSTVRGSTVHVEVSLKQNSHIIIIHCVYYT